MVRLNPISLSGGSSGRDASDVAVFRLGWRRIEMRFSWLQPAALVLQRSYTAVASPGRHWAVKRLWTVYFLLVSYCR